MSKKSDPPELSHDFNHALFEAVILGSRRELTLKLSPLVWVGYRGHHAPAVTVRFGGIVNFAEVETLFKLNHQEHSELGWLRYDTKQPSKLGELYLHIEFERVEARIVIHCSSLTFTEPEPDTEKAA